MLKVSEILSRNLSYNRKSEIQNNENIPMVLKEKEIIEQSNVNLIKEDFKLNYFSNNLEKLKLKEEDLSEEKIEALRLELKNSPVTSEKLLGVLLDAANDEIWKKDVR